jgi:hypothetical protein
VLLCSPEAAQSDWVDKEVRFWLDHRSAATILPVLTDGTWVWGKGRLRPRRAVGRRVAVVDQTGAAIEVVPTDGTPALRLPATLRAVRSALDGEGHLAVGHVDGTVTVRDGGERRRPTDVARRLR